MAEDLFKDTAKTGDAAPKMHPKPEPEKKAEKPEAETEKTVEEETKPTMPDELTMLKSRAKLMGIEYSNNIGIDALKAKMEDHKTAKAPKTEAPQTNDDDENDEAEASPKSQRMAKKQKAVTLRSYLHKEKMKLVRVRITNLDPKKKDLNGEILTIANDYLGTVRMYVPFGEVTDDGWHVPQCIYDMMKDRKFLSIKTRKGPKGQTIVEQQMAREFALEILDPLTEKELAQLSTAQLASGGLNQ